MLARIQYENVDKQYARMRALKTEVDQLVHSPVTRWYKEVITDFSIHAKEDRNRDDLLFKIYQQYLAIYVDMVQQAQPQSPDLSSRVRESLEWYVATLIRKCGPAVDLLLKLMGPEKQREYTRSVMFGI